MLRFDPPSGQGSTGAICTAQVDPDHEDCCGSTEGCPLAQCEDPEANCQCVYEKAAAGMCGGLPGCWKHEGGKDECEGSGDVWIGN